jgi:hypothetical protein
MGTTADDKYISDPATRICARIYQSGHRKPNCAIQLRSKPESGLCSLAVDLPPFGHVIDSDFAISRGSPNKRGRIWHDYLCNSAGVTCSCGSAIFGATRTCIHIWNAHGLSQRVQRVRGSSYLDVNDARLNEPSRNITRVASQTPTFGGAPQNAGPQHAGQNQASPIAQVPSQYSHPQ